MSFPSTPSYVHTQTPNRKRACNVTFYVKSRARSSFNRDSSAVPISSAFFRQVLFLIFLSGVFTAGCGRETAPNEAKLEERRSTGVRGAAGPAFAYTCDGLRFAAQIDSGAVRLFLPERTVRLPQVRAASGVKYAGPGVTFWAKGKEALLKLNEKTYRGCKGEVVTSQDRAPE